jgi:23S rRNA A2030 N6-methylase RlmJ
MYDHHLKAGNQGDVVKHPALIAAVDTILQGGQDRVFRLFDTFAGYAHNPIVKGNEWQNGIGHILRVGRSSDNPHVKAWMALWRVGAELLGSVYPGSSLFVLKSCQSRGIQLKASLWDTSPTVVAQLMTVYRGLDVHIYGRPAIPSDLKDTPFDFLFIDPPGLQSTKNQDYPALEDLTPFVAGRHHTLLWLPMVADLARRPPPESENSIAWRMALLQQGLSATTVRWLPGGPTCGCQLFYRLPPNAEIAVREAIVATLELTEWNMKEVQHFDRPIPASWGTGRC